MNDCDIKYVSREPEDIIIKEIKCINGLSKMAAPLSAREAYMQGIKMLNANRNLMMINLGNTEIINALAPVVAPPFVPAQPNVPELPQELQNMILALQMQLDIQIQNLQGQEANLLLLLNNLDAADVQLLAQMAIDPDLEGNDPEAVAEQFLALLDDIPENVDMDVVQNIFVEVLQNVQLEIVFEDD